MHIPKRYGQGRVDKCPFCDDTATKTNKQGFTVCGRHTTAEIGLMKCACGSSLDIKKGKYGMFFLCFNCGPVNANKVFDINVVKDVGGFK